MYPSMWEPRVEAMRLKFPDTDKAEVVHALLESDGHAGHAERTLAKTAAPADGHGQVEASRQRPPRKWRLATARLRGQRRKEELATTMMKTVADAGSVRQLARKEKMGVKLPASVLKMTEGYEFRTYYFEIIECFRKLALTGMPVWFEMGSVPQLTFGLLVCFFSFGAYMHLSPYDKEGDDSLSQLCQAQTFFALLASIILTSAVEDGPTNRNMGVVLCALTVLPVGFGIWIEFKEGKRKKEAVILGMVKYLTKPFVARLKRWQIKLGQDQAKKTDDHAIFVKAQTYQRRCQNVVAVWSRTGRRHDSVHDARSIGASLQPRARSAPLSEGSSIPASPGSWNGTNQLRRRTARPGARVAPSMPVIDAPAEAASAQRLALPASRTRDEHGALVASNTADGAQVRATGCCDSRRSFGNAAQAVRSALAITRLGSVRVKPSEATVPLEEGKVFTLERHEYHDELAISERELDSLQVIKDELILHDIVDEPHVHVQEAREPHLTSAAATHAGIAEPGRPVTAMPVAPPNAWRSPVVQSIASVAGLGKYASALSSCVSRPDRIAPALPPSAAPPPSAPPSPAAPPRAARAPPRRAGPPSRAYLSPRD